VAHVDIYDNRTYILEVQAEIIDEGGCGRFIFYFKNRIKNELKIELYFLIFLFNEKKLKKMRTLLTGTDCIKL